MNNHANIIFLLILCILFAAAIPLQTLAQRFNHANFDGGGNREGSRPPQNAGRAPAPAERNPAPVMNRPAEPQAVSRTINGGNRNFGNHDFNRNGNADGPPPNIHPQGNVTVRENVNINRNVIVRENVNVYHSYNQHFRPYAYHPYHPYYWGHNWHPLGYIAASIAASAYMFMLANQRYYYDNGVYYAPASGGYAVVPAPVGAAVGSLPPGYETTMVGNDYFYYYGGAFYVNTGSGYQVVPAPVGAVVTQIPEGAVDQQINGQSYLLYNNTYYQPVLQDGQDAYEVVQVY